MRKGLIATAIISGLVGFASGAAFWYFASPLFIDQAVNESLAEADAQAVLAQGTFGDVDAIHKGDGTATVYRGVDGRRTLRLTDFRVTNGPALEVWLVASKDVTSSGDVTGAKTVSLGRLKGNVGDQNYTLPPDLDLDEFQTVVIWCEQFSVLFSPARLTAPA